MIAANNHEEKSDSTCCISNAIRNGFHPNKFARNTGLTPPSDFRIRDQRDIDMDALPRCVKYEYKSKEMILVVPPTRERFYEYFETVPQEQRKFYELIRIGLPVREYYDIDLAAE